VEFDDLVPNTQIQQNLFVQKDRQKQIQLMDALDRVNQDFGMGRLRYLEEGIEKAWKTRFEYRSPRYTTRTGLFTFTRSHFLELKTQNLNLHGRL
jgi:DNA polymerase V